MHLELKNRPIKDLRKVTTSRQTEPNKHYTSIRLPHTLETLEGIEIYPNLENIIMINNYISDLLPLCHLKSLKNIFLSGDMISDVPLCLLICPLQTIVIKSPTINIVNISDLKEYFIQKMSGQLNSQQLKKVFQNIIKLINEKEQQILYHKIEKLTHENNINAINRIFKNLLSTASPLEIHQFINMLFNELPLIEIAQIFRTHINKISELIILLPEKNQQKMLKYIQKLQKFLEHIENIHAPKQTRKSSSSDFVTPLSVSSSKYKTPKSREDLENVRIFSNYFSKTKKINKFDNAL